MTIEQATEHDETDWPALADEYRHKWVLAQLDAEVWQQTALFYAEQRPVARLKRAAGWIKRWWQHLLRGRPWTTYTA